MLNRGFTLSPKRKVLQWTLFNESTLQVTTKIGCLGKPTGTPHCGFYDTLTGPPTLPICWHKLQRQWQPDHQQHQTASQWHLQEWKCWLTFGESKLEAAQHVADEEDLNKIWETKKTLRQEADEDRSHPNVCLHHLFLIWIIFRGVYSLQVFDLFPPLVLWINSPPGLYLWNFFIVLESIFMKEPLLWDFEERKRL